jgi:hypothetical protein
VLILVQDTSLRRYLLSQLHGRKLPESTSKTEMKKLSTTKRSTAPLSEPASAKQSFVSAGKSMQVRIPLYVSAIQTQPRPLTINHLATNVISGQVWDSKPVKEGAPINWVELKTSAEILNERGMENFNRKLMKFWIQSFLLGVPKIVVGFRDFNGILRRLDEIETEKIPDTVTGSPRPSWNANMCVNFAAAFLECESFDSNRYDMLVGY